jgi:hypothetical protein
MTTLLRALLRFSAEPGLVYGRSVNRRQRELRFRTHGGARDGAGRPSARPKPIHHGKRIRVVASQPMHVTCRVASSSCTLRRDVVFAALRVATIVVGRHEDFRIVHPSIQRTHLHFCRNSRTRPRSRRAGRQTPPARDSLAARTRGSQCSSRAPLRSWHVTQSTSADMCDSRRCGAGDQSVRDARRSERGDRRSSLSAHASNRRTRRNSSSGVSGFWISSMSGSSRP